MSPLKNRYLKFFTVVIVTLCLTPLLGNQIRMLYNQISRRDTLYQYDKKGVSIIDYGIKNGKEIGLHYNPTVIAQQAIVLFDSIRANNNYDTTIFWNCIHQLEKMVHFKNNYAFIPYSYDFDDYNVKKGWQSGMAQGQVMQAFIRAAQLAHTTNTYDSLNHKLLNHFKHSVEEHGFTYKLDKRKWWYEEYASASGTKPYVLNGMIYTLIALREYANYYKDPIAFKYFNFGNNALNEYLPKFDNIEEEYSFYDLKNNLAVPFYHNLHIELLNKLYLFVPNPIYINYSKKWQQYQFKKEKKIDFTSIVNKANFISFLLLSFIGILFIRKLN